MIHALVFAALWPAAWVWLLYAAVFRRELRDRRRLLGEIE